MKINKNEIETFLETTAINPTTIYTIGELVSVGDERRYENYVYKATYDHTTSGYPNDMGNLYVKWVEWNPANDYAMLDYYRDTVTNFNGNGYVIFERGSKTSLTIGEFNATKITIEYLDLFNNILDTDEYSFDAFLNKYDPYTYIYGEFYQDTTSVIYQAVKRLGSKIKVSFENSYGANNYCGLFSAGSSIDMGKTLDKVNFSVVEYGTKIANQANFNTIVDKNKLMYTMEKAKISFNDILVFIIDESELSFHNNMIILGKLKVYSGVGENLGKNSLSWTIEQNIRI